MMKSVYYLDEVADLNFFSNAFVSHQFFTRDHPFKTSAIFRGRGVPLPTFADSRGVGV